MSLIRLQRCCHRKSAHAIYAFNLFKLEVYLRNNKPCKNEWGWLEVSCYLIPNTPDPERESENFRFTNYADFRSLKKELYQRLGTDKRLKKQI